jgi:hypothetical protein
MVTDEESPNLLHQGIKTVNTMHCVSLMVEAVNEALVAAEFCPDSEATADGEFESVA